jgi:nicotinate-nucleotide pyrophosphorylase (carboxylating)
MPPLSTWGWLVDAALVEDLGPGDVTSRLLVDAAERGEARVEAREPLVLAGTEVARTVFARTGASLESRAADGERVEAGTVLAVVAGPVRAVLEGERVALNFLQRLSGVATLTRAYADAIGDTGATLLDTRKTTPGWRALEKFAVRCGGGENHRKGLFDGILIKDNHIAAVGSVTEAVRRAREGAPPGLRIEVEIESVESAQEAIEAGADVLLVDNQPPAVIERLAKLTRGRVPLEASGGIRLDRIGDYARAGARWISVGAITHSAPAVDIALEWESRSRS